ncbi:MAG: hypothetical protein RSG86_07595, partial [Oscillospiraceae bacterium]
YVGVATAGFYDRFVIHVQEGASAQEQTIPPVYEDVTPESKTPETRKTATPCPPSTAILGG